MDPKDLGIETTREGANRGPDNRFGTPKGKFRRPQRQHSTPRDRGRPAVSPRLLGAAVGARGRQGGPRPLRGEDAEDVRGRRRPPWRGRRGRTQQH